MAEKSIRQVSIESLIDNIKPYELLWNPKVREFKNKFKKEAAWNEIAKALQISDTTAKAKWKNIKDIYKKEMKKFPVTRVEDYEGSWAHFEAVWFLYEGTSTRKVTKIEMNESHDDTRDVDSQSDCSDRIQFKVEPETEVYVQENGLHDEFEPKRARVEEDDDYDMMFLKSLAPYLRALRPIRKLAVRNRIQQMLLDELGDVTL